MRAITTALLFGFAIMTTIADAAPLKVAVLGTRPVDDKDRGSVFVSAQLTLSLRAAAANALVPTDKSFAELVTKYKCDSEMPRCLAAIGIDLGADFVVYGKVERRGDFAVSVRVLDVRDKTIKRSVGRTIRRDDATETEIKREAAEIYEKLLAR